jgi:ABC-2 type transport system ATP-binding protein
LIAPSSGTASIDGMTLTRESAGRIRGRVGFLTEAPGLWDRLTVRANLIVYARLYGVTDPARAVDRGLEMFGLADRRDDPAALLSKGMKQKLALARALLHDPVVVLLDEPTAGLDPGTARMVRELVLELRRDARTIIISTHNLDEAERVADRVAVLQRRLVAVDTPDNLRRRLFGRRLRVDIEGGAAAFSQTLAAIGLGDVKVDGDSLSVGIEDDPERQAPSIVRALVAAGAGIRRVVAEEPPLEEVYLKLLD